MDAKERQEFVALSSKYNSYLLTIMSMRYQNKHWRKNRTIMFCRTYYGYIQNLYTSVHFVNYNSMFFLFALILKTLMIAKETKNIMNSK